MILSGEAHALHSTGNRAKSSNTIIQGNNADFLNSSFILHGEIMIPVNEFFKKLNINVNFDSSYNQLIVYNNNIFIKLTQNNFYATVNGKKNKMPVPAFFYKGELMASAEFLLKALEIEHEIIDNTIYLNHLDKTEEIRQHKGINYKKFILKNYNTSIFLPETFHYNNAKQQFYTIDHFNEPSLEILPLQNWKINDDITPVITLHDEYSLYEYQDKRKNTAENGNIHRVSDYRLNGIDCVFRFHNVSSDIQSYIISSIKKNIHLPNRKLEHYYEFPAFAKSEMNIQTNLYSNILVKNAIAITGTAKGERLVITVQKDNEEFEYTIPIKEEEFQGKLFLPFGIGKHNITIRLSNEKEDIPVLIFSALNTDNTKINNLVPTSYLDYEHPIISEALSSMGYRGTNQKITAKTIYYWILQNYTLNFETSEIRKLSTLVEAKGAANPKEICILYTGLLRATGIPARIATNREAKEIWVEAYLNGKWMHMGIISDFKTGNPNHFYQNIQIKNTEYLEY